MRIFTDLHHGDLYWSLHRLFVERLGHELYRPLGYDWYHAGFWKIGDPYPNPLDTARQYLDIREEGFHPYICINGEHYKDGEVYNFYEPFHEYYQKAITFETFKSMRFDIILSTFPAHDKCFIDLKSRYQPQAKSMAQLGNTHQTSVAPNVIHSVPYTSRPGQQTLYVHQELDLRFYSFQSPDPTKNIYSVVNCFPYPDLWNKYKTTLSDVNMKNYGGGCPDGALYGGRGVGEKMREANIGWHLKPLGGLGHSAMAWYASGRPTITNMSQHRSWGGDATRLFEPGVTCHDIEAHTVHENEQMIRKMLEPEENLKWCQRAKQRFDEIFNYAKEEQDMRKLMESLI